MRLPAEPMRYGISRWRIARTCLLIILGLMQNLALAWGPVGHRAVGAVADDLLSTAARAQLAELLADDRDREGRPSSRHSLAEVADWADEIRGTPADHPHWHYDNRPVCDEPSEARSWCARGECASAAFSEQLSVLSDPHRSRSERNEALKWVVHLAGDLHQPLHAAELAEGGNRIRVDGNGRSGFRAGFASEHHDSRERHGGASLHGYWDNHLVAMALHPAEGVIPARSLQLLREDAREFDAARVAAPPEQWATESNEIARRFALVLDGVSCDSARDREAIVNVHLSRAYQQRGAQIVEARLALAGARLAYVLNHTLGEQR